MRRLSVVRGHQTSTLGLVLVPVVTFFLGLLIGGLEGGLGEVSNYGPIAVYLILAIGAWAAVDWVARRQESDTLRRQ